MKKINLKLIFSYISAQSLNVTFRYIEKPTDNFVRVFIPGTMPSGSSNDWGPNSNGIISPDAPSQMIYNQNTDSYEKSYSLSVGTEELYKVHYHFNQSGSESSEKCVSDQSLSNYFQMLQIMIQIFHFHFAFY